MEGIPLFDYVGTPLVVCLFGALLWLQWRFPLRRQHFALIRRIARNFIFSIPAQAVFRWALLPAPLAGAILAQHRQFGLLNWIPVPGWIGGIISIVLLDYAYWWWHWANHMVRLFWRFHNVHHTDLDMDVSTAARFHFGEMLFSVAFFSLAVALIGAGPIAVVIFFILFDVATIFHHSNWRLPIRFERMLNHVFVTPRMHGIHHSIVERETNSNWGTMFCWWDKLHGTLRRDIAQDEITIGVAAYRDESDLTFGQLWTLPFRRQREYWQLPNGEHPERAPQPIDQLPE